ELLNTPLVTSDAIADLSSLVRDVATNAFDLLPCRLGYAHSLNFLLSVLYLHKGITTDLGNDIGVGNAFVFGGLNDIANLRVIELVHDKGIGVTILLPCCNGSLNCGDCLRLIWSCRTHTVINLGNVCLRLWVCWLTATSYELGLTCATVVTRKGGIE